MASQIRKALLVDDKSSNRSLFVKQLETLGFYCSFARSFEEARAKLSVEHFDVVLSKISMNGGTAYELRPLLIGRPIWLFYSLSVEEDCWWIPGVRRGKECLGEPALRPGDLYKALALAIGGAADYTVSGMDAPAD